MNQDSKFVGDGKMFTKTAMTLLLAFMLANACYLMHVAEAAAGAASAAGAGGASAASAAGGGAAGAAGGAGDAGAGAAAAGAGGGGGGAAAANAQGYGPQNGPFSQVQGLVGGALSIASMPLNTITTSLNQLGLQNLATAPFNAVSNLIHQAGGLYGK